ncbi:uncharacterized protein LOC119724847 [Patiria miniata]|uniref:Uncharacterized protein n=1 Tax=Patiria miniata TaxID=46514 RepID=A0A913ZLV7_PATMI|nr:uncharacterized protein LOC119724847 [Patiria miniata]
MAARLQLFLLLVTCLCCADSQGTPNTTGIPSATDPDAERDTDTTLPNAAEEPTTPAGREIPYACPTWRNKWHTCRGGGCGEPTWRQNYCHCDPLCVTYGDCCSDYEELCGVRTDEDGVTLAGVGATDGDRSSGDENIEQGLSAGSTADGGLTKCVQTVQFDPEGPKPRSGYRLVAVCPRDWTGAASVRKLCQETVGMAGLAAVPVEGSDGRHYRNVYCALCHGLPHTNVTFWSISYQEKQRSIPPRTLNTSQLLQLAKGQIQSDNYTKFFRPPGFASESVADSSLRTCIILDADSCPISDPRALELCQRHYAPIAWNGTTYRNFACLCDDVDTQAFSTDTLSSWCPISINKQRAPPLSMASLLVFSDRTDIGGSLTDEGSVGSASACTRRQIYDPFLASCRDLSCPDGFALQDGGVRCARIRETGTGTERTGSIANVEVALTVTGSLRQDPDARSTHMSTEIWEEIAHQAGKDYQSGIFACKFADEGMENNQIVQENEFCGNSGVKWSCTKDVAILDSGAACLTGSLFTCSVNMTFVTTAPSIEQFLAENEMVSRQCFAREVGNHTIRPDHLAISTPCETLSNDTPLSIVRHVSTSKVAYVRDNDSGHHVISQNDTCMEVSADCPLLTFSREDYVITGALNDSIRLNAHDRVLPNGEFHMKPNGDVEVCNFLSPGAPSTAVPTLTWDYAHHILTITGSSLSLIGLVVTIATYVAFPTLRRNAAGKALMSLVAALFLAQFTMLVGLNRTDVPALCVTFAISSHFFWLAAFFWMNILAVDIYRTFGIGTSLSDPNVRSFLRYALYGWGAPTLIVATVAILSFCDCVDADVSYGTAHACWVGNGTANLLSFGLPIVVILCSNAVLFSLTVAGVKRTRMASKRMNITQGQSGSAAKRPNNDLFLYLKLTAIMGFTWVFGFVASFSGVEFFWYPYIALNSLQGALVCLAFVCNRRVLAMWRSWLKSRRGRYLADQSDTSGSCRGQRSFKASLTEQSHVESGSKTTDM